MKRAWSALMMKNKKDNIEKEYFKDNIIFSNLINYYLYNGEKKILPDDLIELDTESNIDNISRKRDILKLATMKTDGKYNYLLLGIENQTKDDKYMVIRNMLYDSLTYERQRTNIDNYLKNAKIILEGNRQKIFPVITIIIYFSHKEWKGPRDLHSLLKIDKVEPIKRFIPNYKLNIIEPYKMEDTDFKLLDKDLSILFKFIKNSDDENKLNDLIKNNQELKAKNETIRLINEITKANLSINKYEEETKMCKAIDDMKKHAREQGKKEKLNENIKTMYSNGADETLIAKLLNLDINYVKKILA